MELFLTRWARKSTALCRNGVRLRFIGERAALATGAAGAHARSRGSATARQRRAARCRWPSAMAGGSDIVLAARGLAARVRARRARSPPTCDEGELRARRWRSLASRSRPVHPHRRRAAHQQFPAVEPGLHRAVFHRHAVAGFRRGGVRARRCSDFAGAAASLRPDARAGGGRLGMLRSRILTAIVLGALLVALLLFASPVVAGVVLGLIMLVGAWEWSGFLRLDSSAAPLRLRGCCCWASAAAGTAAARGRPVRSCQLMQLTLLWWLVALCWMRDCAGSMSAARRRRWPACWRWFPPGSRWCASPAPGRAAAVELFIIVLAFAADTGAFFAGRDFGAEDWRRASRRARPGKGVIGGYAGAGAGAWPARLVRAAGWRLRAAVPGGRGAVRRRRPDRKPAEAAARPEGQRPPVPGHGGVLDRIDSVTAAAPVMALGLIWLGVGT